MGVFRCHTNTSIFRILFCSNCSCDTKIEDVKLSSATLNNSDSEQLEFLVVPLKNMMPTQFLVVLMNVTNTEVSKRHVIVVRTRALATQRSYADGVIFMSQQ